MIRKNRRLTGTEVRTKDFGLIIHQNTLPFKNNLGLSPRSNTPVLQNVVAETPSRRSYHSPVMAEAVSVFVILGV
ncbi:hypothetical protein VULLAG_LOCUS9448 [Vulpes lagopus]